MKKYLCHLSNFSFLTSILLGLLVSFLMLCSCKKPVKIDTVELVENSLQNDFIFIPVTINDSVYRFLFDTGSNSCVIDSAYAKKNGLNADGTSLTTISQIDGTIREDSLSFSRKKISIGKMRTTGIFFLNQYKGLAIDNIDKTGAIMGMDIGRKYNWLFNFDDNTVTISKNRISIPALPDDQIFILDYYYSEYGITQMNLTIGEAIIQDVVFDTGYSGSWDVWYKAKKIDIVFSESDFDIVRRSLVKNLRHYSVMDFSAMGLGRSLIIDSLQINDLTMPGIFAIASKEKLKSLITVHFVRRFRMMYYDSMNQKIELYVSPSDSARHQRKDLQNFVRKSNQLYVEHNGVVSENILSKLMELW